MAKNKGQARVPKVTSVPLNIPRQEPLQEKSEFYFYPYYPKWINTTDSFYKREGFTNRLRDAHEFSDNITEITTVVLPNLYQNFLDVFDASKHYGHCHPIPGEKRKLVEAISKEIHGPDIQSINFEELNENRIDWWYIGFKSSLRLVGLYNKANCYFYPMFIDPHHLIHQNEHYNQDDYGNYCYCPLINYNGS
ncbi:hypothetical protein C8U37_101202 [Trichococcus patagoniensis]|uniref:Uncharacterized protein n=1 Tax=Trichococcus patagoniensis TaxID=382641 RepID=A0A2T5IRB9_9LACT|nr:hypothetical protein [Trichococcus patagoniensis]PTQ86361.1 hypothetical protein C8U37_101202 [Trichococcus patagoniensis]